MAKPVPFSPLATYTVVPLGESDVQELTVGDTITVVKVIIVLIIILMIIATIVGNALVCLAVLLVRKLQQPANFLLVSLAVADCLVGLLVMPLALVDLVFEDWPLGRSMCKLWTTADLALCTASIVNLCVISVDRYLVISRPLRYTAARTTFRMFIYIVIVWTVAALVSFSSHLISNLLVTNEDEYSTKCQVIQHFAYQIYATIIAFYGPTLIMVILYVKIWRAARRLAAQDKRFGCNGVDKNGNEKTDLLVKERKHRPSSFLHAVRVPLIRQHDGQDCKARKTLGVIMTVFIVCWLPFFCLAILKSCLGWSVPEWLDVVALWLGYSNSMLNPAIYCKFNKEFRVPFREMLACRCGTLQLVLRQQSFSSRYGPPIVRRPSSNLECSDV